MADDGRPDSMQILGAAMSSMANVARALDLARSRSDIGQTLGCDIEDMDLSQVAFRESCELIRVDLTPPLPMAIILALRECTNAASQVFEAWSTTNAKSHDTVKAHLRRCVGSYRQAVSQLCTHADSTTWQKRVETEIEKRFDALPECVANAIPSAHEERSFSQRQSGSHHHHHPSASRLSTSSFRNSVVSNFTRFAGCIAPAEASVTQPRWHAARGLYDTGGDLNLVSLSFLEREGLQDLIEHVEPKTCDSLHDHKPCVDRKVVLLWQAIDSPQSSRSDFYVDTANNFDILICGEEWLQTRENKKSPLSYHLKLAKRSPDELAREKKRMEESRRENQALVELRRAQRVSQARLAHTTAVGRMETIPSPPPRSFSQELRSHNSIAHGKPPTESVTLDEEAGKIVTSQQRLARMNKQDYIRASERSQKAQSLRLDTHTMDGTQVSPTDTKRHPWSATAGPSGVPVIYLPETRPNEPLNASHKGFRQGPSRSTSPAPSLVLPGTSDGQAASIASASTTPTHRTGEEPQTQATSVHSSRAGSPSEPQKQTTLSSSAQASQPKRAKGPQKLVKRSFDSFAKRFSKLRPSMPSPQGSTRAPDVGITGEKNVASQQPNYDEDPAQQLESDSPSDVEDARQKGHLELAVKVDKAFLDADRPASALARLPSLGPAPEHTNHNRRKSYANGMTEQRQ